MTVLTAGEIASLAKTAGFPDAIIPTAVAVALAESGGDTAVVNSLHCVGLWQINQPQHPTYSITQLQDPQTNADAAWDISGDGFNWNPWQTYTDGTYLSFMPQAVGGASAPTTYTPTHVALPKPQQTKYATPWAVDVGTLLVSGTALPEDLRNAVRTCTVELSIDGASTVTIEFSDPTKTLRNSPLWSAKSPVKVTLDGQTYRFARYETEGSLLTITFEDILVSTLRGSSGHIIAPAGTTTRTYFAQRLCRLVNVPFFGQTDELTGIAAKRAVVTAKDQIERLAPSQANKWIPEDSYTCIARLAGELNWRVFSTGTALWFGSDAWLMAHVAAGVTLTAGASGIGDIDPVWDQRQPDGNEATLTVDGGDFWRPVIAQGVTLKNEGPAAQGPPWLVTDVSRSQFSARATVTLGRAQLDVPGPDAATDDGSITEATATGKAALAVVQFMQAHIGDSYVWGGNGPHSWDCSGITTAAWKAAGVTIPRTSQLQWTTLPRVPANQQQPGDIACFGTGDNCEHVGIYIGADSMIAADNPGAPVEIDTNISTWTDPPFLGFVRPAS